MYPGMHQGEPKYILSSAVKDYENYASNAYVKPYIEVSFAVQEEINFLQESMEEEIDETVSSLDEKDDEESEEQKEEDWISYMCPPSNESNSPTHTLFNFPSFLPKDECHDNCYDPVDSFEISLLMNLMLAMLVAKMPI